MGLLFYTGAAVAIVGAAGPLVLPGLPTALQTGPASTVGYWILNNQHMITLVGLLLMLLAVIL